MTLTVLIALAVVLELAAGTGLAVAAGLSRIRQVLTQFDWAWLPVPCLGLGLAFVGYYFAYRGVFTVEDCLRLSRAQLRAAVGAGFGGAPFAVAVAGVFAYRVLGRYRFWC